MAARTQTIDFLISRLQKICDIENSTHLSSAELFEIMNSAIAETWDLICDTGLGEKYVKSASFNTSAGQFEYSLFTVASDFYRITKLYVNEANGQLRPLKRLSPSEIQSFTAPNSTVAMKLYYLPYSPILTTGQSFDGVNGWEEYALMVAACAVKLKRDEDYSPFARRKMELEKRMRTMGNVDFGEPPRVVRKNIRRLDPFMLFNSNVNAYGVRGDKLEIYCYTGYIP
jgi:hypothetical protein